MIRTRRNPERIKTKWAWIEKALLPTLSVSGNFASSSMATSLPEIVSSPERWSEPTTPMSSTYEMEQGKRGWAEKNSEEDIDRFLSMLSTSAIQQEYCQ